MERDESNPKQASLSDYLAAERTLLAWIRTSLAFMGFGFVVARFGLFLQQMQARPAGLAGKAMSDSSTGASLWLGIALIASGVVMILFSGIHHLRLIRALRQGDASAEHPARLAAAIVVLLVLIGIGIAVYLFRFNLSLQHG